MKVITVSSDRNNPGCQQLQRSLTQFGYSFDHIDAPFEFGGQMKYVYQWCKANWGWFVYTDAWDTFALAGPEEIEAKIPDGMRMVFSAEKNCYPISTIAGDYPPCETEWKYVNGGGFLTTCDYFAAIFEDGSHQPGSNDQEWLSRQYLKRQDETMLDTRCDIFQTIAFEGQTDFSRYVENIPAGVWRDRLRLINNKTDGVPVFIHGNAQTKMDKIWAML